MKSSALFARESGKTPFDGMLLLDGNGLSSRRVISWVSGFPYLSYNSDTESRSKLDGSCVRML